LRQRSVEGKDGVGAVTVLVPQNGIAEIVIMNILIVVLESDGRNALLVGDNPTAIEKAHNHRYDKLTYPLILNLSSKEGFENRPL